MENPQETKSISTTTGSGLSRLWGGANSTRVLIAVNVIPVVGVLFFNWDAFNVVFLFWLENLVIGLFTVLKMVTADPGKMSMREMGGLFASMIPNTKFSQHLDRLPDEVDVSLGPVSSRASLFFLVPFFCVHYGIFMLGHGLFIVFLLGDGEASFRDGGFAGILSSSWHHWMWVALAGLVLEHGREFLVDYLGREKNKQTAAIFQMFTPYGRIIVMHLVIIAGAFSVVSLRLPRLIAVLLVVAKTLMELVRKKRQRAADLGALTD
ncbi:MAG: DUF6498-containing protein [Pirellulaceae bacterium]